MNQPKQDVPRALKWTVYSMGIALLGGFVLFVGVFIDRISTPTQANAQTVQVVGAQKSCENSKASITGRGEMEYFDIQNGVLKAIMKQGDTRFQVMSIDICSGKILHVLQLDTDVSPTAATSDGVIKLEKPQP